MPKNQTSKKLPRDDGGGDLDVPSPKRLWPEGHGPSLELRELARALRQPNMVVPLVLCAIVHVITAALVVWNSHLGWPMVIGLAPLSAVLVAVGYRGLENEVHDGAHGHFSASRPVNDLTTNLLFGWAVAQTVQAFRPSHLMSHHGGVGGADDPCRARMRAHPDVRAGRLPTLWRTLKTVPQETIAYYRVAGSKPRAMLLALVWQAAMVYAPAAMVVGPQAAAVAWFMTMPLALLVILPIIRTFGEAAEHDYADGAGESVLEATFDNRGWLNELVHPFGDDMHVLHHLMPGVPHWRLRRLHRWAVRHDPSYATYARYRSGLLSVPRFYNEPPDPRARAANDNTAGAAPANDNEPSHMRQEP